MSNEVLTKIYGRGWAFPPSFNLDEGVVMAEDVEDIRQSLRILFSTEPGERIMRNNYGCALYDVMFENINSDLMNDIETRIVDSILRYEPRANLTEVIFQQSPDNRSQLLIDISYCLRGSDIEQKISGVLDINYPQRGQF
ncbi:GPW/gp25 family protein [Citrobacter sp. Awk 4]|uniref:GPW/gp25 family protein n=1 Tax=Citrobacter sp. Awk 4 TaxID=2963955 RepID=UPI0023047268|nr:GPW/gp25 family protein [Citrobacter sp. Awk 4]MDA8481216.1 GPW/gp25 family protein [Citrobacter sp. Awk 4]